MVTWFRPAAALLGTSLALLGPAKADLRAWGSGFRV